MSDKNKIEERKKGIIRFRCIQILVVLGLIVSIAMAGCIGGKDRGGTPVVTPIVTPKVTTNQTPDTKTLVVRKGDKNVNAPSTPITIYMSIPLTLSSDNVADVNIMVKSSILDAPDTKVDLILPEGVSLVSGESTWNLNLVKDTPVNLSAQIKIDKEEGELEISAVAKRIIDRDNSWGDIDVAYIGFKDTVPGTLK